MHSVIELLQNNHLIWQGIDQKSNIDTISTGYTGLDKQLGGGFPVHGVIEISSECGIGELRLLTHYIKNNKQRLSLFINPPGNLCSEFLAQQGMDLSQIVLLFPKTEQEALWAAEQGLKSGSCASVLLWHPSLEVHQARRLQVASETGHCLHFFFRTEQSYRINLPISLSMRLHPYSKGVKVTLNKRKGGWLHSTFCIDLTNEWPYLFNNEEQQEKLAKTIWKQA